MSLYRLLKRPSPCQACEKIAFYPMKAMSAERWREYFPFLQNRPDLAERYENDRQRFIQLVPDDYEFEAILHLDFGSLQKAASGACTFCQLVEQRLRTCYRGHPSSPDHDLYDGILVFPAPDRPDPDLKDLQRSSPRVWLEISLEPFDRAKTTLQEALTDAFVQIKLANTLVYPRFLLSDVHPTATPPHSEDPPWKRRNVLKAALLRSDSDTGSKANFKLASQWLNTCRSKHKHCLLQDQKDEALPTRLLDLSPPEREREIALCLGKTIKHEATKEKNLNYVTLSHRWGDVQPLRTTSDNYEKHLNGIRFSALPKLFQEAVLFTRAMNVRYLWIDSLCIVQDSEVDKGEEIPRMAKIYGNASFNIAACSAADSTSGLFAPRDAEMLKTQRISFTMTLADGHKEAVEATCSPVLRNFAHSNDEVENVLDDRGWIFQERALSKRIFYFEKKLLWFECREMIASENLPSGAPRRSPQNKSKATWNNILPEIRNRELSEISDHLFHARMEDKTSTSYQEHVDAIYRRWYAGVPDYVSRKFTFETDRLLGVSGLAARVHEVTGDTYLAGLWKSKIVEGLCWAVTGEDSKCKRFNKVPRAPTWSWASMKGPTRIQTPWSGDFAPQHEIEVLDAWTRPNETNPFGDAPAGELKVRGRIKRGQAWSVMTPGGSPQSGFGVASLFDPDIDLQNNLSGNYMGGGVAHIYMDRLKFYTWQPWPVWILPILSYWPIVHGEKSGKKLCALVLRKVGHDTFSREGFLWRLSKGATDEWDSKDEDGEGSWFGSGCEEVEIKII